jgi:hypothetical protein
MPYNPLLVSQQGALSRTEKRYGSSPDEGTIILGSPKFRLASAMGLKKKGARYIGSNFEGEDVIECVRTGERVL